MATYIVRGTSTLGGHTETQGSTGNRAEDRAEDRGPQLDAGRAVHMTLYGCSLRVLHAGI